MDCKYINTIPTTKEFFYKNETDEGEVINIHICNGHSGSVTVTIAISNQVNSTGIPMVNKSMSAGETITLTDVALNSGMFIYGTATVADVVGVKVDLQ